MRAKVDGSMGITANDVHSIVQCCFLFWGWPEGIVFSIRIVDSTVSSIYLTQGSVISLEVIASPTIRAWPVSATFASLGPRPFCFCGNQ